MLLQVRGQEHPATEAALGHLALALPSGLDRAYVSRRLLVGGGDLGHDLVKVEVILKFFVVVVVLLFGNIQINTSTKCTFWGFLLIIKQRTHSYDTYIVHADPARLSKHCADSGRAVLSLGELLRD